jgi:uncharacterized protein YjbI with pentapeptide repeats
MDTTSFPPNANDHARRSREPERMAGASGGVSGQGGGRPAVTPVAVAPMEVGSMWPRHWTTHGQPWRTEPEIDAERRTLLGRLRASPPSVAQGHYPLRGMRLTRADVEWLLATHDDERGPVRWSDVAQRQRRGLDLRGAVLRRVNLADLPLARLCAALTRAEGAAVADNTALEAAAWAILEEVDLHEAHLEGAFLSGVRLAGADLHGAHLEAAELEAAELMGADLRSAHLEAAELMEARLERAQARCAHLAQANCAGAHLEGADLTGAHLQRASLIAADLQGATLVEAHLWRSNLEMAVLVESNLSAAHLEGADLREAQLCGALLVGAHLEGALLAGAQLQGALLVGAHLDGADLSEAQLEGANLRGAHLSGVYGANLYGANLHGAEL